MPLWTIVSQPSRAGLRCARVCGWPNPPILLIPSDNSWNRKLPLSLLALTNRRGKNRSPVVRPTSSSHLDCLTAVAYAYDMKPSRYKGFQNLPTPHSLTLPRLLITTLWALCGALLWFGVRRPWGKPGYYVFSVVGCIAGLTITRALLVGRLRLLFPFPLCQQGKCHRLGQDYVWRLGTLFGYEGKGIYLYKCRCGDLYMREGKRFMELLQDDTRRPYKKLVAFRKWADDSAERDRSS
jgi:hypothetical protein